MSDPKATPGGAPYRGTKVFISYRRDGNAGDAERLYDELKRYFSPRRLFLDVKSIRTGDSFLLTIETALDSCRALLAVIGPRWLGATDEQGLRRLDDTSDMVRRELSAALSKGTWVIPVLMHRAAMPKAEELPHDLRRLAECQAVEIRSGYWETDVRELVALLKRRLYRRRRLATALSSAAVLLVVAACSYYLATSALPVDLGPDGQQVALPSVEYHDGQGRQVIGAEAPQEMVVEGLSPTGEVFSFDGKPVTDIRADFDGARFQESTVNRLELNPDWARRWEAVVYLAAHAPDERKQFEKESHDFERACSTSVALAATADDTASPLSLSLFQVRGPAPLSYREINLQADRELAVNLDVKTVNDSVHGPNCSKLFQFGSEMSIYKLGYSAALFSRAQAPLSLRFMPMDQGGTSPRKDLLRLGEKTTFDIATIPLRASRVVVRTRGPEEIRCDDARRRTPTVSFDAWSADGQTSLRLQKLEIGADHFRLVAEGKAYVRTGCRFVSPPLTERLSHYRVPAVLLLLSACLALIGLVHSIVRL